MASSPPSVNIIDVPQGHFSIQKLYSTDGGKLNMAYLKMYLMLCLYIIFQAFLAASRSNYNND